MATEVESQPFSQLDSSASGHRFNDDLLMNPGDLDRAQKAFPYIAHVLDHPDLRDEFQRFDVPANAAKKGGRVARLFAIGMGAISLAIAAATPVYRGSPHIWVFGLVAAFLGVASILIGFGGVLYAGAKRRWLCNRVMTERLRQFHFQSFVCRWREIAASLSGTEASKNYADQRQTWLHTFLATLPVRLDSELTDLLDDESPSKCRLHPLPPPPALDEAVGGLDELFSAYRDLRIMHQIHYANHKLRSDQNIFSWSLRLQEVSFSYTILLCILAIFVIHLWIAFSILLDARIPGLEAFLFNYESAAVGIDVHVGVIWVAIAALAVRALQEGLQPEREIERYRHYRASVRAIRDRFDQASSSAEKLEVMQEMERLSFDEFVNFLRSNNEARFVI